MTRGGAAPSPLVVAAQHPDRRLRFAAIDAIMKLKPSKPFAGSSRVVDGLGFFATSFGVPRVLVAHPNSAEAQQMAGLAAELGYESDIATNGRQAFDLATKSADHEFALIHSAIDRPAVDELLAQLRRDRRTRLLPVGVVAPLFDVERVKRFADNSSRAVSFLQPQNIDEMKLFSGAVLARTGRWRVTPAERQTQAIAALDWLAAISRRPQRVFDISRLEPTVTRALFARDLAPRAIEVLGHLGTASGQRNLLEVANVPTHPLATRKAAVAALFTSIHEHGIMLTGDEIMQQYDLYNDNAGRDVDTHAIASAILDALEQKNPAAE
jgi:CheY-like chemotaxis protein